MGLKERFKKFVDDHTLEIALGVGGLCCLGVGIYIGHELGMAHHESIMIDHLSKTLPKYNDACFYAGANALHDAIRDQAPELHEIYHAKANEVGGFNIWEHKSEYPAMTSFRVNGHGAIIEEDDWFNF